MTDPTDATDQTGQTDPTDTAQAPREPPAKAGVCEARLASGRACRFRAKHEHEGHRLCGVHAHQRAAAVAECPVCLDAVSKRALARMECGHVFHSRCIRAWFRRRPLRCPMCRAACLGGLCLLGPRLAPRLLGLTRTLPPPPRAFFPAYIISHLEDPKVAAALGADQDLVGLLVDLACECFTRDNFFAKVRAMGL